MGEADRAAAERGLHDARVAKVGAFVGPFGGVAGSCGEIALAEEALRDYLVHRARASRHATADVRHARNLEQPLYRAVLPERPVQRREHDVDLTAEELLREVQVGLVHGHLVE